MCIHELLALIDMIDDSNTVIYSMKINSITYEIQSNNTTESLTLNVKESGNCETQKLKQKICAITRMGSIISVKKLVRHRRPKCICELYI